MNKKSVGILVCVCVCMQTWPSQNTTSICSSKTFESVGISHRIDEGVNKHLKSAAIDLIWVDVFANICIFLFALETEQPP